MSAARAKGTRIAGFATIPLMVVAIRWMFDENLDDW